MTQETHPHWRGIPPARPRPSSDGAPFSINGGPGDYAVYTSHGNAGNHRGIESDRPGNYPSQDEQGIRPGPDCEAQGRLWCHGGKRHPEHMVRHPSNKGERTLVVSWRQKTPRTYGPSSKQQRGKHTTPTATTSKSQSKHGAGVATLRGTSPST